MCRVIEEIGVQQGNSNRPRFEKVERDNREGGCDEGAEATVWIYHQNEKRGGGKGENEDRLLGTE